MSTNMCKGKPKRERFQRTQYGRNFWFHKQCMTFLDKYLSCWLETWYERKKESKYKESGEGNKYSNKSPREVLGNIGSRKIQGQPSNKFIHALNTKSKGKMLCSKSYIIGSKKKGTAT